MGLFVADYSFSRPDPRALKAAGYSGVLRYVCPDNPNTHGKIITRAEYDALRAAGLTVTLNFEWSTTREINGGYQGGVDDARVAEAQANAIGYPSDEPIYFSCDTYSTPAQVGAYHQGVKAVCRRPIGFYGGMGTGLSLMVAGLVSRLWVANAASWSGFSQWSDLRARVAPEAHLIQHLDHPLGFAGAIDHNEVLRPDFGGGNTVDVQLENDLKWLIGVIKGDKNANAVPNFVTDIHTACSHVSSILATAQSANKNATSAVAALAALTETIKSIPAVQDGALSDADIARVADGVFKLFQAHPLVPRD